MKLGNSRTGSSSQDVANSRYVGRHGDKVSGRVDVDTCGVGVGDGEGGSGLAGFEIGFCEPDFCVASGHGLLHHSSWNVALHRVRRLAHSLKWDIGLMAANHQNDPPMSMTSPTLTREQYAPLLHRSSAAPHSTLPQRSHRVFLRRDLRHKADYFANPAGRGKAAIIEVRQLYEMEDFPPSEAIERFNNMCESTNPKEN